MANDTSTQGISQTQASLLASLMQAQSQANAADAILGGGNTSGQATQGSDFASLLDSVMGLTNPSSAVSPLASTASPLGQQIASIATQLAPDLRGSMNNAYDPTVTPATAQAVWNTPGWGNGNVQCVAFVDGAYQQAGVTLPATPNATNFWSTYASQPGWSEIPNGGGLPRPGDIIAMSGGAQGLGHVAIVTGVVPPSQGQPGQITIAQSNSPTAQTTLPIDASGAVSAWPGYTVQGFIRPPGA